VEDANRNLQKDPLQKIRGIFEFNC
jgi:hypothetical protein